MNTYEIEEAQVRDAFGDNVCLERTTNGALWAMPCTKGKGHEGGHKFDFPTYKFRVSLIEDKSWQRLKRTN